MLYNIEKENMNMDAFDLMDIHSLKLRHDVSTKEPSLITISFYRKQDLNLYFTREKAIKIYNEILTLKNKLKA